MTLPNYNDHSGNNFLLRLKWLFGSICDSYRCIYCQVIYLHQVKGTLSLWNVFKWWGVSVSNKYWMGNKTYTIRGFPQPGKIHGILVLLSRLTKNHEMLLKMKVMELCKNHVTILNACTIELLWWFFFTSANAVSVGFCMIWSWKGHGSFCL